MANYSQLATDIIANVGGAENVTKVIHCITRLRFTLKDKDRADTAAIEALPGVAGAVYNSNLNQYQVVMMTQRHKQLLLQHQLMVKNKIRLFMLSKWSLEQLLGQ